VQAAFNRHIQKYFCLGFVSKTTWTWRNWTWKDNRQWSYSDALDSDGGEYFKAQIILHCLLKKAKEHYSRIRSNGPRSRIQSRLQLHHSSASTFYPWWRALLLVFHQNYDWSKLATLLHSDWSHHGDSLSRHAWISQTFLSTTLRQNVGRLWNSAHESHLHVTSKVSDVNFYLRTTNWDF
jgi:hypothetical protein